MRIRVEFSDPAIADFDRILDHLLRHGVADGEARIEEIIAGAEVLSHSPHIGRPVGNDERELVIGRGSHGYVALYTYAQAANAVFILAVRAQREGGYAGDEDR